MAERLTEYFECGAYTEKKNIIDVSDKVKLFDNGCIMGKAIDKLAQLEDVMEEYGIESVEELKKKLSYYIDKIDLEAENDYLKKAIEKQNIVTQSILKDRDAWKSACELACERDDDCYVYDNIHRAYEFYQLAKNKEKEDERN